MSERAAYSRVYWSVIDDERFANVYDDDRALAGWLRLLLVADQAWPASAHIPAGTNPKALTILVGAGLVEVGAGRRYRIHGLDAERNRRKDAATHPGTKRDPTGTQQVPNGVPHSNPNGASTTGLSLDETSKDETSLDEQAARDDLDGPLAYYEVTTRYPGIHTELHAWTTTLAEGYGAAAFQRALAAEFMANRSLKDLLSRTESRLAMDADRNRKQNGPIRFDRKAWIEQKRLEQEQRDSQGGVA